MDLMIKISKFWMKTVYKMKLKVCYIPA